MEGALIFPTGWTLPSPYGLLYAISTPPLSAYPQLSAQRIWDAAEDGPGWKKAKEDSFWMFPFP